MTLWATDTGTLVKRALSLKDTQVTTEGSFCSLRDSVNPLLCLKKRETVATV